MVLFMFETVVLILSPLLVLPAHTFDKYLGKLALTLILSRHVSKLIMYCIQKDIKEDRWDADMVPRAPLMNSKFKKIIHLIASQILIGLGNRSQ